MRRFAPLALALVAACSSSDDASETPDPPNPFAQELAGPAGKYLGKSRITKTVTEAGVTTHEMDPATGPICMRGDPYYVSTRKGASDDLLIFLQGGGACWSSFCLAITAAAETIASDLDALNPEKETNPFRAMNVVYLPYCDGSLFAGDADHDDDGDGKLDRRQRGLANLSAALDVAKATFPKPKRVVLAGSSGGGYGTILATMLVREVYRSQDILVVNDAGVGLGRPSEPSFVKGILDELAVSPVVPASCSGCTDGGHVTPLVGWALERDPKLRVATFSSYEDYVISDVFLQITAESFKGALLTETEKVKVAHPDRYKRFFVAGAVHTSLLGGINGIVGDDYSAVKLPPGITDKLAKIKLGKMDESAVRGVTFATWLGSALANDASWDDRLE